MRTAIQTPSMSHEDMTLFAAKTNTRAFHVECVLISCNAKIDKRCFISNNRDKVVATYYQKLLNEGIVNDTMNIDLNIYEEK